MSTSLDRLPPSCPCRRYTAQEAIPAATTTIPQRCASYRCILNPAARSAAAAIDVATSAAGRSAAADAIAHILALHAHAHSRTSASSPPYLHPMLDRSLVILIITAYPYMRSFPPASHRLLSKHFAFTLAHMPSSWSECHKSFLNTTNHACLWPLVPYTGTSPCQDRTCSRDGQMHRGSRLT
ncbi:hypothetical protein L227DRAFT_423439 [Lentinus tigrinus ALCF2SS1-6]|uniref:Uncharacterized protein n=1 Tax=Lentinus tigrinus ALCF2SS1-6 TaxID=1328759 RepID=A0A5C2RPF7_9APHY|nr:hypothetical protein L227DRAFT_423439 [Lentinus tigrinus ALCF2SS1-6]